MEPRMDYDYFMHSTEDHREDVKERAPVREKATTSVFGSLLRGVGSKFDTSTPLYEDPLGVAMESSFADTLVEHEPSDTTPTTSSVTGSVASVEEAPVIPSRDAPAEQPMATKNSSTSSQLSDTTADDWSGSDRGHLETPASLPAGCNYERDSVHQKLIAVMGREFDLPLKVAECLNHAYVTMRTYGQVYVKFLGYVCRRQDLLLGKIHDVDIRRHDLVVMCYNASEARIMLTGSDGFYSKMLKQVNRLLGSNKAVFAVTKYPSYSTSRNLLPQQLYERLSSQAELLDSLRSNQVLAWNEEPSDVHIDRLVELAHVTGTPNQNACVLL